MAQQEARLPVRIIGNRLVFRCELSTAHRRIPVNLFLDVNRQIGLELHNKAADGLKVDTPGGLPIKIHVPGMTLQVESRSHPDEDFLNKFTRLYSRELGEVACVGSIGAEIIKNYHVTFDLAEDVVRLAAPAAAGAVPGELKAPTRVLGISTVNDLVWLPVQTKGLGEGGSSRRSLFLSTTSYDSVIDEELAHAHNAPAGDVGAVSMAGINLSEYVAWRPTQLVQVHPDGAFGAMGIELLSHFRIEVDRVNRFALVTPVKAPDFPEDALAFFRALVEEDTAPLLGFLESHKESRLAREAAEALLDLQLDDLGDEEALTEALTWWDQTRIDDLRATEALDAMRGLRANGRLDVASKMGRLGIKSGRNDRYPESVHQLHASVGNICLELKQDDIAWEHLLSASFGLPEDGRINLDLGRFYERKERYRRAMSRYLNAVVTPEAGPEAIGGLERVQQALGNGSLSVDDVEKRIAGRVRSFGAATQFVKTEETDTNRCVLAEFFTNPHLGRRLKEGWRSFALGGALAAEGLISHYPPSRMVLLTYHLPVPEPGALMNELGVEVADSYGIKSPEYFKFNGRRTGPGAGRWRDADKIYEFNRKIVRDELARRSEHSISGSARVGDGRVTGSVTLKGPDSGDLVLHIVLAERGVLYPGKGKVVVHKMMARASLTKDLLGASFIGSKGELTVTFDRSLSDLEKENTDWLAKYEARESAACSRLSTQMDPRQLTVVAFIRDWDTMEVLQCASFDVLTKEANGK